ncbi:hypothetical protein Bca52824_009198 [Brassica carinata]|uniref:Transmembrane protein n=1 Tax=Brassica carinata TaxID=52824 RepID=A0A8X8B8W3_BRACI|nr:hypothetical protein Bca52824_009198 [Brassica carinata]
MDPSSRKRGPESEDGRDDDKKRHVSDKSPLPEPSFANYVESDSESELEYFSKAKELSASNFPPQTTELELMSFFGAADPATMASTSPPILPITTSQELLLLQVNYLAVATAIVGFSLSSSSVSSRLVFVVFLTDVGSVLVSAVMVGVALVCAHGVFWRAPEDLFLDEQETAATGFLSFLASPAVVARA